jgi:hypothetical protein
VLAAVEMGTWDVFYSLILLARDLAILAAGIGLAKWAWDQHQAAPRRRDEEARDRLHSERLSADLGQRAARLEALMVDISTRLDEVVGRERDAELRAADTVAIHRLMHETKDPFLSFAEIEAALAQRTLGVAQAAEGASGSQNAGPVEAISGDRLRRALMELVGDGVIAQLESDRYFVSSDFETGEDDDEPASGNA